VDIFILGWSPSIYSERQSPKVMKFCEVEQLKPLINYGLNVYNLSLFGTIYSKLNWSKSKLYSPKSKTFKMNGLIEFLRDKFLLERKQAISLAHFIFHEEGCQTMNQKELLHKLWIFSEFNDSNDGKSIQKWLSFIYKKNSKDSIIKFKTELEKLWKLPFVLPSIFKKLAFESGIFADWETICEILLSQSGSLTMIDTQVLKESFIDKIEILELEDQKSYHILINESQNRDEAKPELKLSSWLIQNTTALGEKDSYINYEETQKMLFLLADSLFSRNLLLSDVVGPYIIDKVIDGKEYQLLRRSDLLNSLKHKKIYLSLKDSILLKDLIPPLFQDCINLKTLEKILKKLLIREDLPKWSKLYPYNSLSGNTIRVFNKIISFMTLQNYIKVEEFLSQSLISEVEVVTNKGVYWEKVIMAGEMEKVLVDRGVIKRGELDEEFVDFVEISNRYDIIATEIFEFCKNFLEWHARQLTIKSI
jgi:hypothetical protein